MDKSSLGGIILAVVGILMGLILEGGSLGQIVQPTAALIVFGGTFGAVMLQFPMSVVRTSFAQLSHVFFDRGKDPHALIKEIVGYAEKARKEGMVSLDSELENIKEAYLKKSLMLAVDGVEPQELRNIMELEMDNQAEHEEKVPQVFESAGGFSPTIGIIGAVLGLIQVMQHLDNIEEVGKGIAVAFVATIYGVGIANLFLLPVAGKLKIRIREEHAMRQMILEGVISILEGMNPRMLDTKLRGFLSESKQQPKKRKA